MSWNFNENTGSNSQKAEFTSFPEGITRIRVIDEEPFIRWTHWMMQNKRSVNCPGKSCPICEIRRQQKANKQPYTYPMSRRFAINIYNLETQKYEIMEQGIGFFEDLKMLMEDLAKDGKKLSDAIIKVRRRGKTKDDTSYRLDIDTIEPLSSIDLESSKEKLIKLPEYFKPHDAEKILRVVKGENWEEVMKSEQKETEEMDEDIVIK